MIIAGPLYTNCTYVLRPPNRPCMPIVPEHMLAFQAPVDGVVKLARHDKHAGVATVAFPPREKVPTAQTVQPDPP